MSWDKTTIYVIRNFKKLPLVWVLGAYFVSRIPILHCLWPNENTCQNLNLDLFIIQFPYQNIVDFLFSTVIGMLAIEFVVQLAVRWKCRHAQRDLGVLKKNVAKIEASHGETEETSAIKIRIKETEKHLEDLYSITIF